MPRTLVARVLLLLLSGSIHLIAQSSNSGRIVGCITDAATGQGLGFVNVRVDGTSVGTVTNEAGKFELDSVPVGARTLFVSRVGYALSSRNVLVDNTRTHNVDLQLEPKTIEVAATEITGNAADWKSMYTEFVKLLLGNTPNASQCTILNPEVISLHSTSPGSFRATSDQSIRVENHALGYAIEVSIERFERDGMRLMMWLRTSFSDLVPPSEEQARLWKVQRRQTFLGSLRHFLRSLVQDTMEDEGFTMFAVSSLNRPDAIRNGLQRSSVLTPGPSFFQKSLRLDGYLEVEYAGADLPEQFDLRRRSGTTNQVSWIELNTTSVTINADGSIDEFMPFVTHGFWAWERLGEQLPVDYSPDS